MASDNLQTIVRVTHPIQMGQQCGDQYFKYGIEIKTNNPAYSQFHSLTWRRYSEFRHLQKILQRNNCNVKVPTLPTQGIFKDRQHPAFLEDRRTGLEEFLNKVLDEPLYEADRALHLFLQTSLTIDDICHNLDGLRCDSVKVMNNDLCIWSSFPKQMPRSECPKSNEDRLLKKSNTKYHTTNQPVQKEKVRKRVTFCDELMTVKLIYSSPKHTTV